MHKRFFARKKCSLSRQPLDRSDSCALHQPIPSRCQRRVRANWLHSYPRRETIVILQKPNGMESSSSSQSETLRVGQSAFDSRSARLCRRPFGLHARSPERELISAGLDTVSRRTSEISSIWKKRNGDVIRAYAIKESFRKLEHRECTL